EQGRRLCRHEEVRRRRQSAGQRDEEEDGVVGAEGQRQIRIESPQAASRRDARAGIIAFPREPRFAEKALWRQQPDHPADRLAAVRPRVWAIATVERRCAGEARWMEEEVTDTGNSSEFRYLDVMKLGFEESQSLY